MPVQRSHSRNSARSARSPRVVPYSPSEQRNLSSDFGHSTASNLLYITPAVGPVFEHDASDDQEWRGRALSTHPYLSLRNSEAPRHPSQPVSQQGQSWNTTPSSPLSLDAGFGDHDFDINYSYNPAESLAYVSYLDPPPGPESHLDPESFFDPPHVSVTPAADANFGAQDPSAQFLPPYPAMISPLPMVSAVGDATASELSWVEGQGDHMPQALYPQLPFEPQVFTGIAPDQYYQWQVLDQKPTCMASSNDYQLSPHTASSVSASGSAWDSRPADSLVPTASRNEHPWFPDSGTITDLEAVGMDEYSPPSNPQLAQSSGDLDSHSDPEVSNDRPSNRTEHVDRPTTDTDNPIVLSTAALRDIEIYARSRQFKNWIDEVLTLP
ncbi:hypothetical protein I317_00849 [Kwoniella heveanensis CBS 569]|nr:hypothetical protein I317_00849 [Kwoniella heveanensis CBS 569]